MRGITYSLLLLTSSIVLGDEIELDDGSRLTGNVRAISTDGVVTADLRISDEPVEILAEKVDRVHFGSRRSRDTHDAMLILTNGDRLPCEIEAIDAENFEVSTDYAGTLRVPRESISSAQLGIRPKRLLYSGPENASGWKQGDNWHYDDGSLVSDGRGTISRELPELPDSYSISFRLEWVGAPNFQIFFNADTGNGIGGKFDRYYLQFGTQGTEVRRQSTGRTAYHSLIRDQRTPDRFSRNSATFEIRLDRHQSLLKLFIDGEMVGQAHDPLGLLSSDQLPTGTMVVLGSTTSEPEAHRISAIRIKEWDAAGERHQSEERGDFGEDAIINNEGQRFGGSLLTTEGRDRETRILFKSPLAKTPLEVPLEHISTIFLRNSEEQSSLSNTLVIGLAGGGSLGSGSCEFDPENVILNHALLGDLTIDRSAVLTLERRKESEEP